MDCLIVVIFFIFVVIFLSKKLFYAIALSFLFGRWGAERKAQIASLKCIKEEYKFICNRISERQFSNSFLFENIKEIEKEIKENNLKNKLFEVIKKRLYKRLMLVGEFETAKIFAKKYNL